MVNNDIIKLLLIAAGYDKDISIETSTAMDGSKYYNIYGVNSYDEDKEIVIDGFGLYDVFLSFISHIIDNPQDIQLNYELGHLSKKVILNDNQRTDYINGVIERNKQIETYLKETQYITDWKNQNNPCDNCPDKDKNWNDKVHLCNLYYVHNCPKLNDFHNKVSEMYKSYRENKEKM